ncbi:MAG: hypothetical protein R2784_12565 [Saprospiraceae bacterium]
MFYNLSIGAVILRFYLMMGVVILAGFTVSGGFPSLHFPYY